MASPKTPTEVYYRWTDAGGRVHVVDSLDAVPVALRPRVERLELVQRPAPGVLEQARGVAASEQGTLVLGLGAAGLVLFVLSWLLPRGWRWLGKLGAFAAVAALLGGLYLGALRRSTGQSGALLASPSALIDDTRRAVEKINQRQKQQQRELENIQNEAK